MTDPDPGLAGSPGTDTPTGKPPAVELVDAAVRLGRRTIWSEATLEVARGEFVAVLGPNGAGKSTLVKALLGIVPLSGGRATVLGRPPGDAGRAIGYLPQRRDFDPGLRVRGVDIVRLGIDGDRWGLPIPSGSRLSGARREQRRRVDEVIELVGATAYASRPIGQVSGGEQQRLLIAQALVRGPELLLLDEPLDSLDLPNQASVAALVSRLCQERGVTVMIVAHDATRSSPISTGWCTWPVGRRWPAHPPKSSPQPPCPLSTAPRWKSCHASDGRLVVVGEPEAPAHHADRHADHQADHSSKAAG